MSAIQSALATLNREKGELRAENEQLDGHRKALAAENDHLRAENERLLAAMKADGETMREWHMRLSEKDAEIARLKAIEKAARLAHEYHLRGYAPNPDFDANTQLDLMNALGRALEENQYQRKRDASHDDSGLGSGAGDAGHDGSGDGAPSKLQWDF
jgi:chromosome segregation ATPase